MNAKDEFGWRSIFKVYTSKDILKDSLVPILLSISMIIIGNFSDIPSYQSLSTIIDLCIGIIPTICLTRISCICHFIIYILL